jgi:hypothetical protein
MKFDNHADSVLVPALYADPDSDPVLKINADPDPQA